MAVVNSAHRDAAAAVWDEHGVLHPLMPHPEVTHVADVAAIIVSRDRPDLVDALVGQLTRMKTSVTMDVYVIEMGTEPNKVSPHCALRYDDPEFRGKCYGHNVGLRLARSRGRYRYYWILMNDLVFQDGADVIGDLVRIADANSKMAILSPTEEHGSCPDGKPLPDSDYHVVNACDYLSFLMRAECVDAIGFLNPEFKYCWGAIHELAYKVYAVGWFVAYCDRATMTHLGGTTYGKVKGTVSREEYQQRAREFAARYFVEHYGKAWDDELSKVLPSGIKYNLFKMGRPTWEAVLDPKERDSYHWDVPRNQSLVEKFRSLFGGGFARNKHELQVGALRREIDALNPWYYPVRLDGIDVVPGIGARETAGQLTGRVTYLTDLLIGEVTRRYDFSGKRLLDLASNCGYWSARYAEAGAASLLAVEGRLNYIRQGELYWKRNRFMKPGACQFLHGNVTDDQTWGMIRERGPYDFTLCCGILYHILDHKKLLRDIASVTREAVLIDTRISAGNALVREPGGWCFDAIIETRLKMTPSQELIVAEMESLGFAVHRLSIERDTPDGLLGADDYNAGNRVALLAVRQPSNGRQR